MRCKKHPVDPANGVGVCASCLRERLLAVMAAQAQAQAQLDSRKSHTQQQLPIPPRSVSPYISRRKSDATWQPHGQRFHSTPQPVGPTHQSRFSSLRSWFSAIIPGRRKKHTRPPWLDESSIGPRRRNRDRGMSPARHSDDVDDDRHCHAGSSGYSSESSQGWMQTPRRTPATARRGGGRGAAGHSRNVSGLGFCLSPLVRPSPNPHWNQKGMPPEMVVAGESRAPPRAHLSTAASFCKNRSRKLADFGRYTNH